MGNIDLLILARYYEIMFYFSFCNMGIISFIFGINR